MCARGRKLTFDFCTTSERIARVADRATTDRIVRQYLATCVLAARARARIDAFTVHARLVEGALRTNQAFGPARRRRADKSYFTRAYRVFVNFATNAVRTARRR